MGLAGRLRTARVINDIPEYIPSSAAYPEGTMAGNILRFFYTPADSVPKTYIERPSCLPFSNGDLRSLRVTVPTASDTTKQAVAAAKNYVKVYPNPAQDLLNIQYQTDDQQVFLNITDLVGQEIFNKQEPSGANVIQLATTQWSNGSYIYQLKTANGILGSGIFVISRQV
jgi:hypothetical protein